MGIQLQKQYVNNNFKSLNNGPTILCVQYYAPHARGWVSAFKRILMNKNMMRARPWLLYY